MKKIFLLCTLAAALAPHAQTVHVEGVATPEGTDIPVAAPPAAGIRFGYVCYDSLLVLSPGYTAEMDDLAKLREAYNEEMKRVENDFNQKYEAFLEGRAEYPRTILLKRQQELQDLLQHNVEFKNECMRELAQREQEIVNTHRAIIRKVVAAEARYQGLAFVLDSGNAATLFIDPAQGVDLQEIVIPGLQTYGNSVVDEDGNVLDVNDYE